MNIDVNPNGAVIIALDCDTEAQALGWVHRLGPAAEAYKVGMQLLTAVGPSVVHQLLALNKQVFLDLKLHEIPHSVAQAVRAAGAMGVNMVSVHGFGGSAVLRAAVDAARPYRQLKILALTVITSMGDGDLPAIGIGCTVAEQVRRLALLARDAGCHGVIASAHEAQDLRQLLPAGMLIVTPGTQLPDGAKNDQFRTATPAQAKQAGSTHIVVGRAVTNAPDPELVFAQICADFSQ